MPHPKESSLPPVFRTSKLPFEKYSYLQYFKKNKIPEARIPDPDLPAQYDLGVVIESSTPTPLESDHQSEVQFT